MSTADALSSPELTIEDFLAQDHAKDMLRFSTAGSVDDGKSTLIGRLLYDSKSVYEDQIQSVAKASVNRSTNGLDLSLLTDGLRAEREQGITIDVAYRYFSTARRKFIIADTPGHEQYTRNMATGASTADLAIVLIDARNGVLPQSRRHAFIASLLGIPRIAVAVNKMDLVAYDQKVFDSIRAEFTEFLSRLPGGAPEAYFLPISALVGDNVVTRSDKMAWFDGVSLLEFLETVPVGGDLTGLPFRFPVQRVVRPDQDFRGYAGQIASGVVHPGDPILVLPSGRRTRVKSIVTYESDLELAHAPMSVTLTLDDEIDISRGDLLCTPARVPSVSRFFEATVVWMSEHPLDPSRRYLLKHTTQLIPAEVRALRHRVNIQSLEPETADVLSMNAIGVVEIESSRPLYFDPYTDNRGTGGFILIDAITNNTVAAGMMRRPIGVTRRQGADLDEEQRGRVTPAERIHRYGHSAATLVLGSRVELAHQLERRLFQRGSAVVVIEGWREETVNALEQAGFLTVIASPESHDKELRLITADGWTAFTLPEDDNDAVTTIVNLLESGGILFPDVPLTGGAGI